jgi:hypothetical protein
MDAINRPLQTAARQGTKRLSTPFGDQPRRLFDVGSYDSVQTVFSRRNSGRNDVQPPGISASVLDLSFGFAEDPPNNYGQAFSPEGFDVNPLIVPFGRRYRTAPTDVLQGIAPPGIQSLAVVYREPPAQHVRNLRVHTNLQTRPLVLADPHPLAAQTLVPQNAIQYTMCAQINGRSPDDYKALQPLDLWLGPIKDAEGKAVLPAFQHLFPDFNGFALDGVVMQEQSAQYGGSTSHSEGTRPQPWGSISTLPHEGGREKLVTVAARGGHVDMIDLWDGRAVEGDGLYVVMRKFPRKAGEVIMYKLTQKGTDVDQSGLVDMEDGGPHRAFAANREVDSDGARTMVPLLPYEWGAYVSRTGEPPPLDATLYVDEWGRLRMDALVLKVGVVNDAGVGPRHMTMGSGGSLASVQPLRSIERALKRPAIGVIVNIEDCLRTIC